MELVVDAMALRSLLRILQVYTASILPPMLYTLLYLHVASKWRINGLETFQKSEPEENCIEKDMVFFKPSGFRVIWGNKLFTVGTLNKTA